MTESDLSSEQSDKRKTAYFSWFAASHLSAFRPHYLVGETLGKGPEVWRNVSEHCLVAGVFADILAEELNIPQGIREDIVQAALLHDWYKKHESLAQRETVKNGELSLATLRDIKEEDSSQLKAMGVPLEVIALTGANAPRTVEGPQTLPEKIIWYVDAMLSNTVPVSIQKRFQDAERGWDGVKEDPIRAERNRAFSDLYKEQYEGMSLYEVQQKIGEKIGSEFSQSIGYTGDPEQLPQYLQSKLEQRIKNF